jgi:hypothetical protein
MIIPDGIFSAGEDIYNLKAAMISDHDVVCGEPG